jgi:hypothetical protein
MKNKQLINEHDQTKMMLDIIRYGIRHSDAKRINENEDSNDVITPAKNDGTYTEEYKKLSDSVDPSLQITKFKIYPKDRDVQLDGRLDSGINFFMSTKAQKLKISITDDQEQAIQIYLDEQLLTIIQKLSGYYENWKNEWAQKLNTEYKPK